jgi:hypothetical protein
VPSRGLGVRRALNHAISPNKPREFVVHVPKEANVFLCVLCRWLVGLTPVELSVESLCEWLRSCGLPISHQSMAAGGISAKNFGTVDAACLADAIGAKETEPFRGAVHALQEVFRAEQEMSVPPPKGRDLFVEGKWRQKSRKSDGQAGEIDALLNHGGPPYYEIGDNLNKEVKKKNLDMYASTCLGWPIDMDRFDNSRTHGGTDAYDKDKLMRWDSVSYVLRWDWLHLCLAIASSRF